MDVAVDQHDRTCELSARRVLFVGWQGANLRTVQSLLSDGRLVHLQNLIQRGAQLQLTVPPPAHAAAAWTTLATGTRPHEHGVLHSQVPAANDDGLLSVSRRNRRRPAIWNYLTAAAQRAHVVGWPVTSPAEDFDGICVSDAFIASRLQAASASLENEISPRELRGLLEKQCVVPSQLDAITVGQMLPHSASGLPVVRQIETACRSILAEAASCFRIFRWCLDQQPWGFAACVFPGLRRAHELAAWLSATVPGSHDCACEIVAGCYEHHDLLLGQILAQQTRANVLAVSLGRDKAAHGPLHGLAAIAGPDIRHLPSPARRSALDVTPTILSLLDLLIPDDLAGSAWTDLFNDDTTAAQLNHRTVADVNLHFSEQVHAGEAEPPANKPHSSVTHLVELGYTDPHAAKNRELAKRCRWETQLQRAISMLDAGLLAPAINQLETCVREDPDSHASRLILAEALLRIGRRQAARDQIEWLRFHGNEQPHSYRVAALIEQAEGNLAAALDELRGTHRGSIRLPGADVMAGNLLLRQRKPTLARDAFQSAVDAFGDTPDALAGLAAAELQAGNAEAAALHALDALADNMEFARAHYFLGVALAQLNRPAEAVHAFEAWARIAPTAAAPYRWMARLCEQHLDQPDTAAGLRHRGREVVRKRRALKLQQAADTSAPLSTP